MKDHLFEVMSEVTHSEHVSVNEWRKKEKKKERWSVTCK